MCFSLCWVKDVSVHGTWCVTHDDNFSEFYLKKWKFTSKDDEQKKKEMKEATVNGTKKKWRDRIEKKFNPKRNQERDEDDDDDDDNRYQEQMPLTKIE